MGKSVSVILATFLAVAAGCATPPGEPPASPPPESARLAISDPVAEGHGLSSVSITDPANDAEFRIMFDASSEAVARRSIPVLAGFYREIADLVAADASTVAWSDVLFARNADDLLLARKQDQVLWRIEVPADGQLDAAALRRLYVTIPHEQVHATQGTLPRWYSEGQAEWAGLRVARQSMPELEAEARSKLEQARAASVEPLSLAAWGGVRPKIEAILRQLTPEQRAQFLEDPASVPLRAMSFGPDDLLSDESNTLARYAGALALFEQVESTAGREALQDWFKAVRGLDGRPDTGRLLELARELTGEDIGPALE